MKKIFVFTVIVLAFLVTVGTTLGARPGGLPDLAVDEGINDCDCRLFPECCAKQEVVPPPAPAPVAAPEPVPPPPPPAPIKEKVTIVLNVLFDTDKSIVKDEYSGEIKKVADFMNEFPDTVATIEGHTDEIGTKEYNQNLSENRANSVRQYLIDKFSIDGSRISAIGYGEDYPVAENDTVEGRQKNRRVEAVMEAVRIIQP